MPSDVKLLIWRIEYDASVVIYCRQCVCKYNTFCSRRHLLVAGWIHTIYQSITIVIKSIWTHASCFFSGCESAHRHCRTSPVSGHCKHLDLKPPSPTVASRPRDKADKTASDHLPWTTMLCWLLFELTTHHASVKTPPTGMTPTR